VLTAVPTELAERRALRVRGLVQGVGFRPFVHRLAHDLGLTGWVLNDAQGVSIEVQGTAGALAQFEVRLRNDAPPLARVEQVQASARSRHPGEHGFAIRSSRSRHGGPITTSVPPDTATCNDCLTELFNPTDRRHRYAFINCTQCGPRYTLTSHLPYDRAQTSMARFAQCPACLDEYTNPSHRRFHAEPNACSVCGPRLELVDMQGLAVAGDAIAGTLALLRAGRIVAIKGLGGFHLACDARNAAAVALLRQRKHREEKPFAVMAASVASAGRWVHANDAEQALLQSPERPVVLLAMSQNTASQMPGIAPGLPVLGVMLPCTPIQFLLFHEAAGRPAGNAWLQQPDNAPGLLLVMTSANPGGEPLVRDNSEALSRLGGIADAVLMHDRDIVARCDDSVLRMGAAASGSAAQFIRRARGYTPRPIALPAAGPSVLATGAWLKNTVCITRGDQAFLSPHIGDLDNAATCEALVETVEHLCAVLDVQPQCVAHDLHPDFYSTRFAQRFAAEHQLPAIAVQHHHAHVAAVAAEHRVQGPLLGLALDGVGLGSDGSAWGGELLLVDGADFQRLSHLAPLTMPGGDAAARQPWRMAAAALQRMGRGSEIEPRFAAQPAAAAVAQMLTKALHCPATSSMGRWFDAAAGLLSVRHINAFEGQAPMLLEGLAARTMADRTPPSDCIQPNDRDLCALVLLGPDGMLDPTPLLALLARMADGDDAAEGALLFHHAMAHGLARWVVQAAQAHQVRAVALAGGCFLNALLTALLAPRLESAGLHVLQARQAPPNDGGIALGQAWVAICHAQPKLPGE